MTNSLPKALAIGVGGLPGWTPEQAQAVIKLEKEKATKAGFELNTYNIQLSQTHDEILGNVSQILTSQQWEYVALGFGIRGNRDHTPLFEMVVNTIIQDLKPVPKLAFPIMPDKIVEALERLHG